MTAAASVWTGKPIGSRKSFIQALSGVTESSPHLNPLSWRPDTKRWYTVSKDDKSGLWYAHMKGFSYVPVGGSFSAKKSDAMEYARLYDNLPNKVEEIESRRHAKWLEEYGDV